MVFQGRSLMLYMRDFRAVLLLFVIWLCTFGCNRTEDSKEQNYTDQIDQLVSTYHQLHQFNGVVLVAKEGKIIFQKGYGPANRELNVENDVNTRFRIASITKQFTGMLTMILKQEGKLKLEDPVSKFLPYYRKDIGNKVNIHHLLTHTSGIPEYTGRDDFFSSIAGVNYQRNDFIKRFCSDTLQFEPGAKFSYSNSGYYILGAIIEAVTGKTYAEVLKEKIFDVVGMKNSGCDIPSIIVQGRASGYDYKRSVYSNADFINVYATVYAAGCIYSTVGDLFMWGEALTGNKLLSEENKEILFTPFLNMYAYGLVVSKAAFPGIDHEVMLLTHTGGINGFRSVLLQEIEDKEIIVILSNMVIDNNYDLDLNPIANRIFSIINDLPYEMPENS